MIKSIEIERRCTREEVVDVLDWAFGLLDSLSGVTPMPENVPPKETAKADGLSPDEQAPGVPRDSMADDALARAKAKAATDPKVKVEGAGPATGAKADPDAKPGDDFVRVNWKEKIGGHERDGEWCERRRAEGLVASGHAEIVEEGDKAK